MAGFKKTNGKKYVYFFGNNPQLTQAGKKLRKLWERAFHFDGNIVK
jgi:hypothetical protein